MLSRFVLHLTYRAAFASVLSVAAAVAPSHPRLAVYMLSAGAWLLALSYGGVIARWIATGRGAGGRILSLEAGAPRVPLREPLALELAAQRVEASLRAKWSRPR